MAQTPYYLQCIAFLKYQKSEIWKLFFPKGFLWPVMLIWTTLMAQAKRRQREQNCIFPPKDLVMGRLNISAIRLWSGGEKEEEREKRSFPEGLGNGSHPLEGREIRGRKSQVSFWIPVLDHDHSDYDPSCFCTSKEISVREYLKIFRSLDTNTNSTCSWVTEAHAGWISHLWTGIILFKGFLWKCKVMRHAKTLWKT